MKLTKDKVVIFNGPAKSGKDTFADMLSEWIDDNDYDYDKEYTRHSWGFRESFKETLITLTIKYYQISYNEWEERYDDRKLKEQSWDKLGGLSQREALIDMSENKIKPILGNDFFGKAAAHEINIDDVNEERDVYIFSDGGFEDELKPIIDKVSAENVIVFRLHRDGYTFEGDSRDFLTDEMFNGDVTMIDIKSDDIKETFARVLREFLGWVKA